MQKVGETATRHVDVRVVAASNRNVRRAAGAGRFRADLLYRLEVIRLEVPRLRVREGDVMLLTAHYW